MSRSQPVEAGDDASTRGAPVRVLSLMRYFPPAYSGAGQQAFHLARALRAHDTDMIVVCANTAGAPAVEEMDGIQIHRLPPRPETAWGRFRFAGDALGLLVRLRRRYDILHLYGVYRWFTYVSILAARLLKKPVVIKLTLVGSDDPLSVRSQALGRLKSGILRLADLTVCLSRDIHRRALDAGYPANRLLPVPNGVDLERFRPAPAAEKREIRTALGLPADGPIVAFTGVPVRRKGMDLLLDAWRGLSSAHPGALLVLLGPTEDPTGYFTDDVMRTLQERVGACAPGSVRLAGRVPDIQRYLRAADIFAFPSRAEGLPNALLEAMACSLAAVASRIPGVVDVAGEGEVLLVEPGNVAGLTDGLARLLADAELRARLGRAARERVGAEFSLDALAARYATEYRRLLRKA